MMTVSWVMRERLDWLSRSCALPPRFSGCLSTRREAWECGGCSMAEFPPLHAQLVTAAEPLCWLERSWRLSSLRTKVLLLPSIMQWRVWQHSLASLPQGWPLMGFVTCILAFLSFFFCFIFLKIPISFTLRICPLCICMTHAAFLLYCLSFNFFFSKPKALQSGGLSRTWPHHTRHFNKLVLIVYQINTEAFIL